MYYDDSTPCEDRLSKENYDAFIEALTNIEHHIPGLH